MAIFWDLGEFLHLSEDFWARVVQSVVPETVGVDCVGCRDLVTAQVGASQFGAGEVLTC